MSVSRPTKTTKPIHVSAEAWEKARKMAGLRKAKSLEGADMGPVASDAILTAWESLPVEVREFLDQPETAETPTA